MTILSGEPDGHAPRSGRVDPGHHGTPDAHGAGESTAARWEAQYPIVPVPDPVDGAIDSRIVLLGEDWTIRHWSPQALARVPAGDRAPTAWRAVTPGWWVQLYRHGENPECRRRVEAFMAAVRARCQAGEIGGGR